MCVITGTEGRVSYECRAARTAELEINCSHGDVVEIQSAEFGFIQGWTDWGQCLSTYTPCMLSPDHINALCYERRRCNFGPEVFRNSHCFSHLAGDVIKVTYNCTDGK